MSTEVELQYEHAQEQELQTQGSVSVSRADAHRHPGLFCSGITAVPGHRVSSCCLNWAVAAWHPQVLQSEAWSNPSLLMCLTERGTSIRKMNISYVQ